MKKNYLIAFFYLLINLCAFSQQKDSIPALIKEDQGFGTPYRFFLRDANWHANLGTSIHDSGYEYAGSGRDTAKVNAGIREIISPVYHNYLRESNWGVVTRVTSYGQIVSVGFIFKEDPQINLQELSELSAWIKKGVRYELEFDKAVKDTFYLLLSFPGNKF